MDLLLFMADEYTIIGASLSDAYYLGRNIERYNARTGAAISLSFPPGNLGEEERADHDAVISVIGTDRDYFNDPVVSCDDIEHAIIEDFERRHGVARGLTI